MYYFSKMYCFSKTRGFTLVELAIVMTIIGLLIGGVIKGQELIKTARINATIAQVQGIRAATIAFRDAYGYLPGDLPNSDQYIPGCTQGCLVTAASWGRNGDGAIGSREWDGEVGQFASIPPSNPMTYGNVVSSHAGYEVMNFWTHLYLVGLIGGVTDEGINAQILIEDGVTNPSAAVGGGFRVATTTGTDYYSTASAGSPLPLGQMLFITSAPMVRIAGIYSASGLVITPTVAAQIDRKMDDGMPASGDVRGGGDDGASGAARCYLSGSRPAYNENSSRDVCKLFLYL